MTTDTMMNEEKLIKKVQKLLALADNNSNENEAQAAYARAQELIAEYSLDMSKASDKPIEITMMKATHTNNNGYRKPLAVIIADNFRVKVFMQGNDVVFFGQKLDVEVAVEVFNHAYAYSRHRGLQLEYQARKEGRCARGLANSYWTGFMQGIKSVLDEQCKALMIVIPDAVEKKWAEEMVPGMRKGTGGQRQTSFNTSAYAQGYEEGKEHLRKTKSLEGDN